MVSLDGSLGKLGMWLGIAVAVGWMGGGALVGAAVGGGLGVGVDGGVGFWACTMVTADVELVARIVTIIMSAWVSRVRMIAPR